MKNKKRILKIIISILIIIALIIIIYIFYKNTNKNLKTGNNLSNKTSQEIEEYILNISSYEAEIELEVETNKNKTMYKIKQSYTSPNIVKQVAHEPDNISGLETTFDGEKLTINNTKLNLSTVYQNYQYITSNFLWLNSFIEEYKTNGGKIYEENQMIIMEVSSKNSNPYNSLKKLFINKETGKITKMIVQDKNQKKLVYILYNEIKINSLKKEDILAFKFNKFFVAQY